MRSTFYYNYSKMVNLLKSRTTKEFWTDHPNSILDNVLSKTLREYLKAEEEKIKEHCQKTEPKFILEAGCGQGRVIEIVLPHSEKVIGVDYSPSMVRICSEKFREHKKVKVYEEDMSDMHFPDEHFDLVILAFNTLGNIDTNKEKVLLEAKRVLKPEGTILLSVYSENAREVQHETYKKLGLNVLKEENNRIYTREGLVSQRFSKEDLKAWLQVCGLQMQGSIESILDIGYIVKAGKK